MSYLEAAQTILRAAKRPLTVHEITDAALARGLIQPRGKTPKATMRAAVYVYVRQTPGGRIRRLCKPGPGRAVRDSVRWVYAK